METTIDILRDLCDNKAVRWTAHMVARLQERGIQPSDIRHCVRTERIIEQYPNDYPFPSCLVLGCTAEGRPLHAVMGVGNGLAWLVTAYYPDPAKWSEDFSHRKENEA